MGPLIPGTLKRFVEPDERLLNFQRQLRTEVQEGAHGLYVFQVPVRTVAGTPLFALVEAYPPDEMRTPFIRTLEPPRLQDLKEGRLVVVATVPVQGSLHLDIRGAVGIHVLLNLDPRQIIEIRRCNRAARGELRRSSAAVFRKLAIENQQAEKDRRVYADFADLYEDGMKNTREYGMGKVHIPVLR
jgi:hypothetical protein